MKSARLALAATTAAARGAAGSERRSVLKPLQWRSLSSAASKPPPNPFEIDLKVLQTSASTSEKFTLDDAKRAAAQQQADAQREINLLHEEMSSLFGEEVAEYGGDSSSSSVEEAAAAFDKGLGAAENVVPPMETSEHLSVRPARVVVRPKKSSERKVETVVSGESSVDGSDLRGGEPVDVLLLQGPCSFVRGVWTGGDVEREELQRQIHELADELKIAIKSRNYESEKIILQMLLEARPEQVIVLTWNVSLTKSPFIVHALELIRSRVIVVSPIGVDHGPLPANVVGVLSGFWNQSLSLAINAAANLIASDETKKISTGVPASQLKKQQSSSAKGKKKKVFTCNLCGEEGHIRRNCPKLPKSKK